MLGSRAESPMRRSTLIFRWLAVSSLAACTSQPTTSTRGPKPTVAATLSGMEATAAESSLDLLPSELGYTSLDVPLAGRSAEPVAGLAEANDDAFALITGDYRIDFVPAAPVDDILLSRAGYKVALALRPLGKDLGLLQHITEIRALDDPAQPGVRLAGSVGWADFTLWLWVYPHNPGLVRYHLEMVRLAELPAGSIESEWTFVDATSGDEMSAGYSGYAEKAAFAAPSFYGYVESMDSTLLHWVDVTRLNPFIEVTRFSPGGLPGRQ
jgi:hypothetical protein